MDATKDCKVLFNTLIQRMWKDHQDDPDVEHPLYNIDEILLYTSRQSKTNRFFDLKDNKFCFLESVDFKDQGTEVKLITGFFKSARNEFRPDLINKRTGKERKNPKELTEGDIEKTHFLIKIDKEADEVYLFLEYNFYGVNINNVVGYFTCFRNKYLVTKGEARNSTIKYQMIVRDDFLAELESVARTRIAEIYFDKKLLGSRALNFSNRTVSLRKELKLVASASPQESIKEVAIDFYNALNRKNSEVSKVRVYGVDENSNEVILDTSFMSKVEFVGVDVDQNTGEVNSTQLFTGMKRIANSL